MTSKGSSFTVRKSSSKVETILWVFGCIIASVLGVFQGPPSVDRLRQYWAARKRLLQAFGCGSGFVQCLLGGRGVDRSLNSLGMSMNTFFHCSLSGLELLERGNKHDLTQSSNHG